MSAETLTKRVYFTGRVQGVGFRWSTEKIARNFAVIGYVKNLEDGRVEMVASGEDSVVDEFISAVNQHFSRNITDCSIEDINGNESFSTFEIRR